MINNDDVLKKGDRKGKGILRKWITLTILSVVFFIVMIIFSPLLEFKMFFSGYIDSFAAKTGINSYLVKAIGVLFFIPWLIGTNLAIKFWNQSKQLQGISLLIILVAAYNFGLYWATKDYYAGNCYAETSQGIEIFECNEEMKDPVYGYNLKPITPIDYPKVYGGLDGCNQLNPINEDLRFFNARGEAQVWFFKDPNGQYEFFDSECHHPKLGVPLEPVTREVVIDWQNNQQDKLNIENGDRGNSNSSNQNGLGSGDPENTETTGTNDGTKSNDVEIVINSSSSVEEKPNKVEKEVNWQNYINLLALERIGNNGKITIIVNENTSGQSKFNLTGYLRNNGINAETNILMRAFFEEGLTNRLKEGDPYLLQNLGLSKYHGNILFFDLSLNNPIKNELYVLKGNLNVRLVPLRGNRILRRQFEARGSGFTVSEAREQFYHRVQNDLLNSNVFEQIK